MLAVSLRARPDLREVTLTATRAIETNRSLLPTSRTLALELLELLLDEAVHGDTSQTAHLWRTGLQLLDLSQGTEFAQAAWIELGVQIGAAGG